MIINVSCREKKELMYIALGFKALLLYRESKTMTCDEVLNWINQVFRFPSDYASVRGVLQAAYRRADDEKKEALATVFTDKNGNPLVKD